MSEQSVTIDPKNPATWPEHLKAIHGSTSSAMAQARCRGVAEQLADLRRKLEEAEKTANWLRSELKGVTRAAGRSVGDDWEVMHALSAVQHVMSKLDDADGEHDEKCSTCNGERWVEPVDIDPPDGTLVPCDDCGTSGEDEHVQCANCGGPLKRDGHLVVPCVPCVFEPRQQMRAERDAALAAQREAEGARRSLQETINELEPQRDSYVDEVDRLREEYSKLWDEGEKFLDEVFPDHDGDMSFDVVREKIAEERQARQQAEADAAAVRGEVVKVRDKLKELADTLEFEDNPLHHEIEVAIGPLYRLDTPHPAPAIGGEGEAECVKKYTPGATPLDCRKCQGGPCMEALPTSGDSHNTTD